MARVGDPRPKTPAEMRAFREAAAERARIAAAAKAAAEARRPVQEFWDLVNTSAGPDGCHTWSGKFRPGDGGALQPWYPSGVSLCGTALARRIVCFLTYGHPVPVDRDTTNLCDTDGCCNVRHIVISPKGGNNCGHDRRLQYGVPAEEFFCS